MATTTRTVTVPEELNPVSVFGPVDEVIRQIERAFPNLGFVVRGNRVGILSHSKQSESDAAKAQNLIETIIRAAYSAPVDAETVRRMLERDVLRNHVRQADREALIRDEATAHHARVGTRPPSSPAFGSSAAGHGTGLPSVEGPASASAPAPFASSSSHEPHEPHDAGDSPETAAFEHGRPYVPGVITFASGIAIRPKTAGQIAYVQAISTHTITFGIGPAGTGKTYLAVAKAVRAFRDQRVRHIILTRPAVEAGENLGFLPGTLNDKVDPYLRPLYDALGDMLGASQLKRYMDDGTIEVAPLAYMRGRTLNDAFVILDEAQNATEQQMKMFLTRLGFNTTMVITGDVTQIDIAVPHSGLATIERILHDIDDIAFVHLRADDIVRHALVGRIVAAYERHAERVSDTESKRSVAHDAGQRHAVPHAAGKERR